LPASKPGLSLALMTFNEFTEEAAGMTKIVTSM
jgi:hypothetical protein